MFSGQGTFVIRLIFFFSVLFQVLCNDFSSLVVEEDCQKFDEPHPKLLEHAMRRGFWTCAKEVADALQKSGKDAKSIFEFENRNILKEIQNLKNAIESSLPMSNVNPAFQWAQSPNDVLLNVKFAHKLDAPATLNVEPSNVNITSHRLELLASNGRKNFKLELDLLHPVVPDESSWSMASVGRMTFQLRKEKNPASWARLLKSSKKLSNMHFWYEMQDKHQKDLDQMEKDLKEKEKERKEQEKLEKEKKTSSNFDDIADNDDEEGEGKVEGRKTTQKEKDSPPPPPPTLTEEQQKVKDRSTFLSAERKKIDERLRAGLKNLDEELRAKKKTIDQRAEKEKDEADTDFKDKKKSLEDLANQEKEKLKSNPVNDEL